MTIPDVFDTGSPYWLQINGSWVHLEGVAPGVDTANNRASSEFISVDGVRYVQQAPAGPRDWTLTYEWASPVAVSALMVAAEANQSDVWLLDTTLSRVNMLNPLDCYGTDSTAPVVDCGGVPLRALPNAEKDITVPVRAGVTYNLRAWSVDSSAGIGNITYPGADGSVGIVALGYSFTPDADGDMVLSVYAHDASQALSGLMLTEDIYADVFIAGQSMPCKVAVSDPERTVNLTQANGLPLSDYSVTVREVGP